VMTIAAVSVKVKNIESGGGHLKKVGGDDAYC
jgi:hypothetical protein